MRTETWYLLAATGIMLLGLVLFSLRSNDESKAYRFTLRTAVSALLLWISGSTGGVGLNALNLAVLILLGVPGYAALSLLTIL